MPSFSKNYPILDEFPRNILAEITRRIRNFAGFETPSDLSGSFVALYKGAPGLAMLDGTHVVLHHLLLPPVFYWLPAVAALHAEVLHLCKEIVYRDEYKIIIIVLGTECTVHALIVFNVLFSVVDPVLMTKN